MSAAQMLAGIGQYSFWGASASFDILEALHNVSLKHDLKSDPLSTDPIRVLLLNPSDIRHVVTTLSNRFRRGPLNAKPIEVYVLDSPIEVIARDILLLEVLNDFDLPIRQRANVFLEIFGNCKVQERTSRYIDELGAQLRNLIAHGKGRLEGLVDLSMLKYREKDMLEDCFKSYSTSYAFDIDHYRDYRLRGFYGDRYDSRVALADWDYHEAIKSRASIIHIRQYKDWRASGIAFEFGDQQYTHPNRTLMAFAEGNIKQGKDKGLKKEVKGYWGDVVNSPYFSYGVDCETVNKAAEGLFDIHNKNTGSEQHRHHTVEVALFNVLSLLYQIETREVYVMKKDHDIFSGLGSSDSEPAVLEKGTVEELLDDDVLTSAASELSLSKNNDNGDEAEQTKRAENIVNTLKDFKFIPVLGPISEKLYKPRYEGFFDFAFVGAKMAQIVAEDNFGKLMKKNSVLAVETAKFFLPLPKPLQKQEFVRKIDEYSSKHFSKRIPAPVPRRHRDELDTEDDVVFYLK